MTMTSGTRRTIAHGALALGCVLVWGALELESADARGGGRGGGGGFRGGGGARVNVGPRFNGPRSFDRPPATRPPTAGQLPATPPGAGQLPSGPPGSGQGGRPVPPSAGTNPIPPLTDQGPPHPAHPIVIPPGSNRPDRPPVDRPPVYYPYPPDYIACPTCYPGYWPPPYEYTDPVPPPPASTETGTVAGSLPADCREVVVAATAYRLCGTTWYAPRFAGNQIVYVVVPPPT